MTDGAMVTHRHTRAMTIAVSCAATGLLLVTGCSDTPADAPTPSSAAPTATTAPSPSASPDPTTDTEPSQTPTSPAEPTEPSGSDDDPSKTSVVPAISFAGVEGGVVEVDASVPGVL